MAKKIIVLASGGGGNLLFLIKNLKKAIIKDTEIVAVFTDRKCPANIIASNYNIQNFILDFTFENQKECASKILQFNPDVVVANINKILSSDFIKLIGNKLINLHYSMLPAFGAMIGTNSIKCAIEYGAKFSGVSVHHVNEVVDGGRPIVQICYPLNEVLPVEKFIDLNFKLGCIALISTIYFIDKELENQNFQYFEIFEHSCFSNGIRLIDLALFDSELNWRELKIEANLAKQDL